MKLMAIVEAVQRLISDVATLSCGDGQDQASISSLVIECAKSLENVEFSRDCETAEFLCKSVRLYLESRLTNPNFTFKDAYKILQKSLSMHETGAIAKYNKNDLVCNMVLKFVTEEDREKAVIKAVAEGNSPASNIITPLSSPARPLVTLEIVDDRFSPSTYYDIYDSVVFLDVITKWNNSDFTKVSKEDLPKHKKLIRDDLRRVIHGTVSATPTWYIKCRGDLFSKTTTNIENLYRNYGFWILDDKNKLVRIPLLSMMWNDSSFLSHDTTCVPYHADQSRPDTGGLFNIFKGYRCRKTDKPKEAIEITIAPFLRLLWEVYANKQEDYYRHILATLAWPLIHGTKSGIVTVLKGAKQGAGKTTIFDFMNDFWYGRQLSHSFASINEIDRTFNDILESMLVGVLEEAPEAETISQLHGVFSRMKKIITSEYNNIESKGMKVRKVPNCCSYFINSNSQSPILIDKDDRRYAVYEINPVLVGNYPFWDELRDPKKYWNQHVGDCFATWLRFHCQHVDIRKIPTTEAKLHVIEMSKSNNTTIFDNIFDGELPVPDHVLVKEENGKFKPRTAI